MQRILIADDQVPDSKCSSEEEIRNYYSKKYKEIGFAEGFVFVRRLINLLKSRGYQVDSANTPEIALELVSKETYSIVILDLGWYTATNMAYDDRMVLGWKLVDEIRKHTSAQIIMFSNRFFEDQELARTAAEKGCLPFYKSYDDICAKNLIVTIRWAILQRNSVHALNDEEKLYSFKMYKRLSSVLLLSVILGLLLLLVTVNLIVTGKADSTVAAAAFGIVSTFVSGVIFKYISEYRSRIY
jgi:CheY-like chemotaxis protein